MTSRSFYRAGNRDKDFTLLGKFGSVPQFTWWALIITQHKNDIRWQVLCLTGLSINSREFSDNGVAMGHRPASRLHKGQSIHHVGWSTSEQFDQEQRRLSSDLCLLQIGSYGPADSTTAANSQNFPWSTLEGSSWNLCNSWLKSQALRFI